MTNTELTTRLNTLREALGMKTIKAGSYSNAKLQTLIAELEPEVAEEGDDTFTLAELAKEMGINPKVARARYREWFNDKVRTYYKFNRTAEELNRVKGIISPKRG